MNGMKNMSETCDSTVKGGTKTCSYIRLRQPCNFSVRACPGFPRNAKSGFRVVTEKSNGTILSFAMKFYGLLSSQRPEWRSLVRALMPR